MAIYSFTGGTANNIWGHSGNWSPPGVPTNADNVIFTAASPGCTVTTAGACLGANFTGYGNTLTFSAAPFGTISVGASGLTLSSGMGITCLGVGQIGFVNGFLMAPLGGLPTQITSNNRAIPRLRFTTAGSMTVNINGTCTITEMCEQQYTSGPTNLSIQGGTINFRGGTALFSGNCYGTSTFLLAPPAGVTLNFIGGWVNAASNMGKTIVIAGAAGGNIRFPDYGGSLLQVINGTVSYVSGVVSFGSAHLFQLIGNSTVDTGGMEWNSVYLYNLVGTSFSNLNVGRNLRLGYNVSGLTFTSPGNSVVLTGNKLAGATGTIAIDTANSSNFFSTKITLTGTGTRVFTSAFTPSLRFSSIRINMSGGTCIFIPTTFYFDNTEVTSSSTNTTIIGGSASFLFNLNNAPGATSSTLGIPGLTLGTGIVGSFTPLIITAPVYFNTLRGVGTNVRFAGPVGWTAGTFIHPGGGAAVTLGITGTYLVTSNFQMTGNSPTAGRAVLQSDTRADFLGTVNNNTLIFTSGTAPFIGGEVSMAQSYYLGPPAAAIPPGLAAILPGRPVVISGGPLSFNISPGVNPATGGNFSVGKKAKFFLGTGATQTVLWATTRDIDSLGPGGLYQSIAAQQSFTDSAGVTGPTLLRTLNWGTLAPPTSPAAFTFVT